MLELELELGLSLERPLESDRTVDRVSNVVVLSLASAVEPKDVGDHERVGDDRTRDEGEPP